MFEQKQLDKMVKKMIRPMDFCRSNSTRLKEDGIKKGQVVFVAGTRMIPNDPEDIYNQRCYIVIQTIDKETNLPDSDMLMVDPQWMTRLGPKKQEELTEKMMEAFKKEEEEAEKSQLELVV